MDIACLGCGQKLSYPEVAPRFCSNCGSPLSGSSTVHMPPADPQATRPALPRTGANGSDEVPELIGGYRIVRPLGNGGMGTVYEAEELATARRVAIKLIRAEFANSPDAVERFRREGKLASTIQHSRCVFVLAADEETGRPYIVMELMPGENLQNLVERGGPLNIPTAVGHTLDIIEGLEEAHRCGVVHRDIKPSNCFLDADGRVKIGDFGLAKSLIGAQELLTRSGAFLGTLLFASPEQIRNDHVDHLTDVYSLCATLYFLLTGHAPFENDSNDAAATLARTVSEPAPSMRKLRPDLPRTLDEVVLRGLQRDRGRRWHSLEALRLALIPFVHPQQCQAGMGWRVSAYLIDLVCRYPVDLAVGFAAGGLLLGSAAGGSAVGASWAKSAAVVATFLISLGVGVVYFAIPEAVWGFTPGKYLVRLRVRDVRTGDRPSLWRSVQRTVWFYLFKDGLRIMAGLLALGVATRIMYGQELGALSRTVLAACVLGFVPALAGLGGLLLIASSMDRRSGLRAVHEWLSGTWLIRLPRSRPRFRAGSSTWPADGPLPEGIARRVGGFHVCAVASQCNRETVCHAREESLGRPVWLWLRPADAAPISTGRRDNARPGRPRWLACGQDEGLRWDAFIAAPGQPLLGVVTPRRPLGWLETLAILEQLTDELLAAAEEGTLPDRLSPQQVWLLPSGQVMLLDAAPGGGEAVATPVELLQQVAATALEGSPRRRGDLARPVQAPVPGPASAFLVRLARQSQASNSLAQVGSDIKEVRDKPAEVSRPTRALLAAIHAVLLAPGLAWMFAFGPGMGVLAYVACVFAQATADRMIDQADRAMSTARVDLIACPGLLGKLVAAGRYSAAHEQGHRLWRQKGKLQTEQNIALGAWEVFIGDGLEPFAERLFLGYSITMDNMVETAENQDDSRVTPTTPDPWGELLEGPSGLARNSLSSPLWWVVWFAVWPTAWVAWAGLTRGGLVRRLLGISLVGQNGRPAARWRCAWRALMIWLPVTLLLGCSTLLDLPRLAYGSEWDHGFLTLLAWSAWGLWCLALLLLPLYTYRGVSAPRRGLHDRLAGIYPVPG